ncbi:MAG: RNA methyltransferase, partial [Candidatus Korobacteraceae bacterium]
SMNLGQAVAVCMYELARNAKAARQPATSGKTAPSARAAEVERITSVLLESLRVSGYLKPRSGAATEEKIRRIVRRMKLNADDAEVLLGMLRQMLWKMREGEGTDGTRGV